MEEQGEDFRRRKSASPKERTPFLKRFRGSVREKARQAGKIWQRGKPCEHPKLRLRASRPARSRCSPAASHRGRTGTSKPPPRASEKRHPLLNLHVARPVSHKRLFSFGDVKNHGGMQRESFLQPAGALFPLSHALGQRTALKKTPHPKNRSQRRHTKTTFCDRAMCYSTGITSPCLPSLPCLFFSFFFPGYQVHRGDSDQYQTALFV